jgi:hypothetical protein
MEEREPVYDLISDLVEHVRLQVVPLLSSHKDMEARQYMGATLARCDRLTSTCLDLWRLDDGEAIGILLRQALELWLWGRFFGLAPEEAVLALQQAEAHQLALFDATWSWFGDMKPVSEVKRQRMPIEQLSKRVEVLLGDSSEELLVAHPNRLYEILYRAESTVSVHAGKAVLVQHLAQVTPDMVQVIHAAVLPDESLRVGLLGLLLADLAFATSKVFGITTDPIVAIVNELGNHLDIGPS